LLAAAINLRTLIGSTARWSKGLQLLELNLGGLNKPASVLI
jgi:hypothetical protein